VAFIGLLTHLEANVSVVSALKWIIIIDRSEAMLNLKGHVELLETDNNLGYYKTHTDLTYI
jgi:hypothetical protein